MIFYRIETAGGIGAFTDYSDKSGNYQYSAVSRYDSNRDSKVYPSAYNYVPAPRDEIWYRGALSYRMCYARFAFRSKAELLRAFGCKKGRKAMAPYVSISVYEVDNDPKNFAYTKHQAVFCVDSARLLKRLDVVTLREIPN
jgi:hypothetical protein